MSIESSLQNKVPISENFLQNSAVMAKQIPDIPSTSIMGYGSKSFRNMDTKRNTNMLKTIFLES